MCNTINLFDLEITGDSAKDLVRRIAENLAEERIYTVNIVGIETLLQEKDNDKWKKQMQSMDLLIPAGKGILSAEENKFKFLEKEIEKHAFPKLLIRFLQKNKKSIYLLAESEESVSLLQKGLKTYGQNLWIIGHSVIQENGEGKEKVINEINGIEPDCIFSALSSPMQEDFIAENKALLNARVWVGCGRKALAIKEKKNRMGKLRLFIIKKILHHQMEKQSE